MPEANGRGSSSKPASTLQLLALALVLALFLGGKPGKTLPGCQVAAVGHPNSKGNASGLSLGVEGTSAPLQALPLCFLLSDLTGQVTQPILGELTSVAQP